MPVYLPMWLVDGNVTDDLQAETGFDYQVQSSQESYPAARAINRNPGTVIRALRLFDALAGMDATGVLAGVREAAAGEGKG